MDHHFEAAGESDLCGDAEGGGAEACRSADDGADARAFAAAEEGSEERARTCADACADERGTAFATGEDSVFNADGFARGCVVELDDLGVDAGGAAVGHDEAVELEDHLGVAGDAGGGVDGADVAVDAGVTVWPLVDDSGAEGVADLRVNAGEGVVETDAEGYVLRDGEGLGE